MKETSTKQPAAAIGAPARDEKEASAVAVVPSAESAAKIALRSAALDRLTALDQELGLT